MTLERISRRTLLKGMLGTAGAAALAGCNANGSGQAAGGRPVVKVRSWTTLGYPAPFNYTGGPGYWRMSLIFDTLLWRDSTGTNLPWLASSHKPSEDGLVHTLDLRDVRWDDGQPLTAKDVAFTYQYYTSHTWTPFIIAVPPPGLDVRPVGDRTVEFHLPRPDATFVQQVLATMPIVPEHIWSAIDDPMGTFDKRVLVSTGAYSLASHDESQDRELYLAKDNYFLGTPFVRRIEMISPPNDQLSALRAGLFSGADTNVEGVTNDELKPFRDNPGTYGIISRPAAWGFPLFFNPLKGGALADVRFRRACLQAINREDMIKRLLTGNGAVGSAGWLSPSNPFYDPAVAGYPFDPAAAERQLEETGYHRTGRAVRTNPDGSPLHYTLYISDTVPIALAELLAANLKDVGVDIDLQRIDLVRLFGIKLQNSYEMLVTSYPGPAGVGPDGDPDILRNVYASKVNAPLHKATGYQNPEVDQLLDQQRQATDVEERKRIVGRIQRLVADDLPVAMLYYTDLFYVYRKAVFDQWYYTPGGFGPGIPDVYNKHPYITGRKAGIEVRKA